MCIFQPLTFTFMHLADTFIQSDLQCIQAIHLFCQYVTDLNRSTLTDELHSCSYARRSTVIGFWKRCFVAARFFEYAANSAGGERLRREGETSCSRNETGDIILLNES